MMTLHHRLLSLWLGATLLLLLLGGCGRVADEAQLRRDVEARLAQALPPGTLALLTLERRGSQTDSKAPAGQSRRIVYYDVELRLARDFDFGAWDAPGVAGLVSALGCGPKGIGGISSGGNKAGDLLHAHGTALYQRDGEAWVALAPAGYQPATVPNYASDAPQGRAAKILEAMRKVIDAVPKDGAPAQALVIEEELAAAQAAIRARLARAADGYAIAAGPEHGQYLRFAQALSDSKSLRMVPLVTRGGEENLRLLRAGKVPLALAQGDAALAAYEGRDAFQADGPYASLRAIGSLYPEPVHVLVRSDQRIAGIADLKRRRVAIGLPGSASRTAALRVLQAHGLAIGDIEPVELSLGEALTALRRQDVAAVIQLIGVPADSIRDALAEVPLRLLPLSPRAIEALVGAKAGLFASSIAAGTYARQTEAVPTVATAALLLVGGDLSETEIGTLTRLVFAKGRDFAAHGSAQGPQVGLGTARQDLPIPQHAAAAKALDALLSARA